MHAGDRPTEPQLVRAAAVLREHAPAHLALDCCRPQTRGLRVGGAIGIVLPVACLIGRIGAGRGHRCHGCRSRCQRYLVRLARTLKRFFGRAESALLPRERLPRDVHLVRRLGMGLLGTRKRLGRLVDGSLEGGRLGVQLGRLGRQRGARARAVEALARIWLIFVLSRGRRTGAL